MSELKENEICIGNYLMELTSDDIFTVSSSWFSCIDVNILCSRPIPLTEEWLLNLGFEKIREYFTIDNEFDVFVNESGFYTHINCGNIILSSVNQLQNLYFALTGKELTHQKIN